MQQASFLRQHRSKIAALVSIVFLECLYLLGIFGNANIPVTGADPWQYNSIALNLVHHHCYSLSAELPCNPTALRTPGYPFFLAGIYSVTHDSVLAVRIVQFACFAFALVLLLRLGMFFMNATPAFCGALVTATYPPLVLYSQMHMTETISTLMMLGFVILFIQATQQESAPLRLWLAQGLLLGCATLVRPSFALLIVLPSMYLLFRRNNASILRRITHVAAMGIMFMALIVPWEIRNYQVAHQFIPMADNNGSSLWQSANQYAGKLSNRLTLGDFQWIVAQQQAMRDRAKIQMKDRYIQVAGETIDTSTLQQELAEDREEHLQANAVFQQLTIGQYAKSVVPRTMAIWSVGDVQPWMDLRYSMAYHRFSQIDYVLVFLAVFIGVVMNRKQLVAQWPLWIVPVYITAIHLVYNVEPRYTMPARPFLFLYAGFAVHAMIVKIRNGKQTKTSHS